MENGITPEGKKTVFNHYGPCKVKKPKETQQLDDLAERVQSASWAKYLLGSEKTGCILVRSTSKKQELQELGTHDENGVPDSEKCPEDPLDTNIS